MGARTQEQVDAASLTEKERGQMLLVLQAGASVTLARQVAEVDADDYHAYFDRGRQDLEAGADTEAAAFSKAVLESRVEEAKREALARAVTRQHAKDSETAARRLLADLEGERVVELSRQVTTW